MWLIQKNRADHLHNVSLEINLKHVDKHDSPVVLRLWFNDSGQSTTLYEGTQEQVDKLFGKLVSRIGTRTRIFLEDLIEEVERS